MKRVLKRMKRAGNRSLAVLLIFAMMVALLPTALLPAMPLTKTALAAEPPGGWPVAVSKVTEMDALPVITVTLNDDPVLSGSPAAVDITFTLTLDGVYDFPISVEYRLLDGSAIAGREYADNSGTVTFGLGDDTKQVSVVVNSFDGGTDAETRWGRERHFIVQFTNPDMAKLTADGAYLPAAQDERTLSYVASLRLDNPYTSTALLNHGGQAYEPAGGPSDANAMHLDKDDRNFLRFIASLEDSNAAGVRAYLEFEGANPYGGMSSAYGKFVTPVALDGSVYYDSSDYTGWPVINYDPANNYINTALYYPWGDVSVGYFTFTRLKFLDYINNQGLYDSIWLYYWGFYTDSNNITIGAAKPSYVNTLFTLIDFISPALSEIHVPKNPTYRPGDVIPITLEFSEVVNFSSDTSLIVNGRIVPHAGVAGSGTVGKYHTFLYTVQDLDNATRLQIEFPAGFANAFNDLVGNALDPNPSNMSDIQLDEPYDIYGMDIDSPLKSMALVSLDLDKTQYTSDDDIIATLTDHEDDRVSLWLRNTVDIADETLGGAYIAVRDPQTNDLDTYPLVVTKEPVTTGMPESGEYTATIPADKYAPYAESLQIALFYGTDITRDVGGAFTGGLIAYDKLIYATLAQPVYITGITIGGYSAASPGYDPATRTIYMSAYAVPFLTLAATVEPTNATYPTTWSSSDVSVATIDEDTGVITPVGAGTVKFITTALNGGIGAPVTAETPMFTVDVSGLPFINVIKSFSVRQGEPLTISWVTNLISLDPGTEFTITLTDEQTSAEAVLYQGALTSPSYTIGGSELTKLSAMGLDLALTPAYTFKISAEDPDNAPAILSASGDIYIYPQPASITFDDLGDGMYITDAKGSVQIGFTVSNLLPGTDDFALSVYKNGDLYNESDVYTAGHNNFPLSIAPVAGGQLKDTYNIMAIGFNASGAATASTTLYVYSHDAIEILVKDAEGSDIAHNGELKLSNRSYIANLYNTDGSDGIIGLRRDINLQRFISINYGDFAWGLITDQIEWLSDDAAVATVNYRQGTLYEPLGAFTYTKYSPGTTFALAGVGNGEATVTATHARTGQSVALDITVETLEDHLYIFQFYPKQETKVSYINGAGQTVDLVSDADGALAVYEPLGITSNISLQSGSGSMVYLGTIYPERLKSGEYDSANRGLYPVNIMQLRNTKLEVYFKLPDSGTPWSGNVTYSGAVYKNGELCPETIIRSETMTVDATGHFLRNLDASKFWVDSNAEVLGVDDKLEFEFVLECGTDNLYYPHYLRVNGNLATVDVVSIGDNVAQLRANAGGAPNPFVTTQELRSAIFSVKKDVLNYGGFVGPGNNNLEVRLVTGILWWGEDPDEDYGAQMTSIEGAILEAQTVHTRKLPFIDMAFTTNETLLSDRTIGPGSVLNLGPGMHRAVKVNALDSGGRLRFSVQTAFRVANAVNLIPPDQDEGVKAQVDQLKAYLGTELFNTSHISQEVHDALDKFEDTMTLISIFSRIIGFGGGLNITYEPTHDPFVYNVSAEVAESEVAPDLIRESGFNIPGASLHFSCYLKGEVSIDQNDGKWKLIITEGGGVAGASINDLPIFVMMLPFPPVTVSFCFVTGLDAAFQVIRSPGSYYDHDSLITFLSSIGIKAKVGFGLPSEVTGGVFGFYIGIYGKLTFNVLSAILTQYNQGPILGVNSYLEGEIGVEAEMTLLFLSVGYKYKIYKWRYPLFELGNMTYIRDYLLKNGVRDYLGGLSVTRAAQSIYSLYTEGQEEAAIRLLNYYTGDSGYRVEEERTSWSVEDRDYLAARPRSWGSLGMSRSLTPGGITDIQTNANPYSAPKVSDDGALMVYRSDSGSTDINDTNISWAIGGLSGYTDQGAIDTGSGRLPAATAFDFAGNSSFAVAAWEAQREDVSIADPANPTNGEMDAALNNSEIVASVYNGSAWVTTRLTDNTTADMQPVVAANANGTHAFTAWKSVAGSGVDWDAVAGSGSGWVDPGDVSGVDLNLADVSNRLCFSIFDGSSWSAPDVLIGNASSMNDIHASMLSDGTIALTYTSSGDVYCMLLDSDGTILRDVRLSLMGQNGNPQIQAVDFGGVDGEQFVIGWYETDENGGGQIMLAAVSGGGAVSEAFTDIVTRAVIGQNLDVGPDFRFAPNADGSIEGLSILWSELFDPQDDAAAASSILYGVKLCRDSEGFYFTTPDIAAETREEEQISSIEGWYDPNSDTLNAVMLIRDWSEGISNTGSRIGKASAQFANEIAADASVNQAEIVHDFLTTFPFYVTNKGSETITAVTIELEDGTRQTYTGLRILPNQTMQLNLEYMVPVAKNSIKDLDYTVTASFSGGGNELATGTLNIAVPNAGITSIEPVSFGDGLRTFTVLMQNLSDVEFDGNTAGYTAHLGIYTDIERKNPAKDSAGNDMIYQLTGTELALLDVSALTKQLVYQLPNEGFDNGDIRLYARAWAEENGIEVEQYYQNGTGTIVFTDPVAANGGNPIKLSVAMSNSSGVTLADITVTNLSFTPAQNGNLVITLLGLNGEVLETLLHATDAAGLINLGKEASDSFTFIFSQAGYSVQAGYFTSDIDAMNADLASLQLTAIAVDFDKDTLSYPDLAARNIESTTLTAASVNPSATLSVLDGTGRTVATGTGAVSYALPLPTGAQTSIQVVIQPEDSNASAKTYSLNITGGGGSNGGGSNGSSGITPINPRETPSTDGSGKITDLGNGAFVETPLGQDPIMNDDGSMTLPGGGKITSPDGKQGNVVIYAPPGTTITPDMKVGFHKGSDGAVILHANGNTFNINEDAIIILDRDTPLGYYISIYNPFTDVKDSDWFFDSVLFAYFHNLMNGTNTIPMMFSPNATMTRAMIVTVLYRMAGSPEVSDFENPFDDVSTGTWYTDAVKWAAANDIVKGIGNGNYDPNAPITRQDLAVILARCADFIGITLPEVRNYIRFIDDSDIANYAQEAIERFYTAGIISGYPNGSFNPKGEATRAEVATMLMKYIEAME
ncbi:MAG: S-layer homology domain-containing protein [Oscillospiraceae bacterium]|nr:S-layer homology domain-containing protein [Oscillospiraceae bacterium]